MTGGGHRHRDIPLDDVSIHVVEEGTGPLVLLVHGFPETSYSWRRQLPVLAAAGYRAAAIDVRGYGRSTRPEAIDAYRMMRHVADNVGVVEALGAGEAVIVGHDWGSPIAATSALLRPDLFSAVALLSVPYHPPGRRRPIGDIRRDGRPRRRVLHHLLPAAGPRRVGGGGGFAEVAGGFLLRGVGGGDPGGACGSAWSREGSG